VENVESFNYLASMMAVDVNQWTPQFTWYKSGLLYRQDAVATNNIPCCI